MKLFEKKSGAGELREWNQFLQLSQKGAATVCELSGLAIIDAEKRFCEAQADPWLMLKFQQPVTAVRLQVQIYRDDGEMLDLHLYYQYDKDKKAVSEENSLLLSAKEGQDITLSFARPVARLRIDPGEESGRLIFKQVSAEPYVSNGDAVCRCEYRFAPMPPQQALNALRSRIAAGSVDPARMMLLLTHETTRTGAPQLCRKLGDELQKNGWGVIYLALELGEAAARFAAAGGVFLHEAKNTPELEAVLKQLADMGVRRAIANTVVCGACARPLHENGFTTVSLIHELWASCQICSAVPDTRILAEYADLLVFPAECVRQNFIRLCGRDITAKSMILRQGLYKKQSFTEKNIQKARAAFEVSEHTKVVISAGAFNFGKGADIIVQVAAQLQKNAPELAAQTCFVWLGADRQIGYYEWLCRMTDQMGLWDRVRFLPYCDREEDYMGMIAAADVFLLPSREDSMPSVLLEAMAAGTPIVSFAGSGGAEELLSKGRGVLTPYMDIEAMTQAVCSLLTDADEAQKIADCAGQYARQETSFSAYLTALTDFFAAEQEKSK